MFVLLLALLLSQASRADDTYESKKGIASGTANNQKLAMYLADYFDDYAGDDYRDITAITFEATGKVIPTIAMQGDMIIKITCDGKKAKEVQATVNLGESAVAPTLGLGGWKNLARWLSKRALRASMCKTR